MIDKNGLDIINPETLEFVTEDLIKIFGNSEEYLTKSECRNILNTKNFNYIFKLISKDDERKIHKKDLEPIIRSFIVCFDVNYITNSHSFNDKVCIKIGKHLLPITYYIKKNGE
jgi:hypothetical protein